VLLACWVASAFAAASAGEADLPIRVGRIADLAGHVYVSPADHPAAWIEIGRNYPVTSGDNIAVSAEGRAEVDYGGGQFRLAGDTQLHLSRLDDTELSVYVPRGRVIVRVRVLGAGEAARVDAPNTQVQLTRVGLYRIDVAPDPPTTTLIVREGEARATLANGIQQALPGQTVTVSGREPDAVEIRNGMDQDGFDVWSADRDDRYDRSRSAQDPYVPPEMVGYADLDLYGTWQQYPDFGAVWFPTDVAYGWAPYADGYWTDVPAFGLTWVDSAPWGYAPFHYGRWAYIGGRWGWCPGRRGARPRWAPALVAWYGGPRWRVSAAAGAPAVYGWVPLGWREPYVPPWPGCAERCLNQLNDPYGVDMRHGPRLAPTHYANSAVPGALTVVSIATLTGGHPVSPNRLRVPAQVAAAAPALAGPPSREPLPARSAAPRDASATARARSGAGRETPYPVLPRAISGSAAPPAAESSPRGPDARTLRGGTLPQPGQPSLPQPHPPPVAPAAIAPHVPAQAAPQGVPPNALRGSAPIPGAPGHPPAPASGLAHDATPSAPAVAPSAQPTVPATPLSR
jgi:hypothetical protein